MRPDWGNGATFHAMQVSVSHRFSSKAARGRYSAMRLTGAKAVRPALASHRASMKSRVAPKVLCRSLGEEGGSLKALSRLVSACRVQSRWAVQNSAAEESMQMHNVRVFRLVSSSILADLRL